MSESIEARLLHLETRNAELQADIMILQARVSQLEAGAASKTQDTNVLLPPRSTNVPAKHPPFWFGPAPVSAAPLATSQALVQPGFQAQVQPGFRFGRGSAQPAPQPGASQQQMLRCTSCQAPMECLTDCREWNGRTGQHETRKVPWCVACEGKSVKLF